MTERLIVQSGQPPRGLTGSPLDQPVEMASRPDSGLTEAGLATFRRRLQTHEALRILSLAAQVSSLGEETRHSELAGNVTLDAFVASARAVIEEMGFDED